MGHSGMFDLCWTEVTALAECTEMEIECVMSVDVSAFAGGVIDGLHVANRARFVFDRFVVAFIGHVLFLEIRETFRLPVRR